VRAPGHARRLLETGLVERGEEALALRGQPPTRGLAHDEPALVGAQPARDRRERRQPLEAALQVLGGRERMRVELEQERLVDRDHDPRMRTAPDDMSESEPVCDSHHALPPLDDDEYVLDTPLVRELCAGVRARIAEATSPREACRLIEPLFTALLQDRTWLPETYQERAIESGMGGGIGQWLLFRAADRSLSLFSLVVPPGAMTPVHDHLAWGLVGLYRGNQDEEFYRLRDARLEQARRRPLSPGDFYTLLPPEDDIHRVRTTSAITSVSIHLLAADTGCVLRHTYDEDTGEARPFRSGYVNASCDE
jgi:predicted metal-dependent enzyme (double-stranded beta helix superfamily)